MKCLFMSGFNVVVIRALVLIRIILMKIFCWGTRLMREFQLIFKKNQPTNNKHRKIKREQVFNSFNQTRRLGKRRAVSQRPKRVRAKNLNLMWKVNKNQCKDFDMGVT